MIHEVDEALRRLVRDEALRSSTVDVAFEAPTREWAARRNAPTVNLFLYDIREDIKRKQRGTTDEADDRGRVTGRRPAPRYMKLSYLLTAWTQRPEDEHRLLSSLLIGLLRCEAIPRYLLAGQLLALGLPLPMTVAAPPPEDRSFADVWTALGGELKPSVDVVVSAPLVPEVTFEAGPPVRHGLRIDLAGAVPLGPVGPEGIAAAVDGPVDERVGHRLTADPRGGGRIVMRRIRASSRAEQ